MKFSNDSHSGWLFGDGESIVEEDSEKKGFICGNASKGRSWLKSLNEIFSAKQEGCRSLSSAYFIQQAQVCILYP